MKYVVVTCINILKGKFLSKKINTDDCIYLDAIEDDLNDLDLIKDIVNILQ